MEQEGTENREGTSWPQRGAIRHKKEEFSVGMRGFGLEQKETELKSCPENASSLCPVPTESGALRTSPLA